MFENITQFFKKFKKSEKLESKSTAKERLHLVLAQDRANISADFLEMMKQEIIEVIKKYIDIDEKAIDVRLTNKEGEDGSVGSPTLYANIPIITIKNEARKMEGTLQKGKNNETNSKEQKNDDNTEKDNDQQKENGQKIDEQDKKDNTENNNDKENKESKAEKIEEEDKVKNPEKAEEGKGNPQEGDTQNNNVDEGANEKKNS